MQNGTLLAAVDLGSHSFRLEIGRLEHGHIHRGKPRKLEADPDDPVLALQRICLRTAVALCHARRWQLRDTSAAQRQKTALKGGPAWV